MPTRGKSTTFEPILMVALGIGAYQLRRLGCPHGAPDPRLGARQDPLAEPPQGALALRRRISADIFHAETHSKSRI